MRPERMLIHQKTTPTTHLHCAPVKALVRAGCSPDFAEYLPRWEQLAFPLPELIRDFERIRLRQPRRWSK
ncbi:MAG: hypothetical protein KatS3mg047_1185 [Bellilinea sp.]|nr:MAG: hypothetical protein KatS3mg047_1185 [Bellilinea sp.]